MKTLSNLNFLKKIFYPEEKVMEEKNISFFPVSIVKLFCSGISIEGSWLVEMQRGKSFVRGWRRRPIKCTSIEKKWFKKLVEFRIFDDLGLWFIFQNQTSIKRDDGINLSLPICVLSCKTQWIFHPFHYRMENRQRHVILIQWCQVK